MCQKKELFTHLTEYLLKYEGNENKNISYQACRVLGNVCYDSGISKITCNKISNFKFICSKYIFKMKQEP